MTRKLNPNKLYRHFKGHVYKIVCLAKDSNDLKELVVYQNVDDNQIWVRGLDEFLSPVDHEKYPDVKQRYRFEETEELS